VVLEWQVPRRQGRLERAAHVRVRSVVIGDKTYDVNAEASPLDALQQTQVANGDPNAEKKKVAGGAIAGAIIGQIIGHSTKGT